MTADELKAKLDALTAVVSKVRGEIAVLKDAVANAGIIPPDVVAAVNNLEAAINAADADNPDA